MKKTFGFLLLFLGLLFVGETTLARTQAMDANVQIEQGVSLSADEMQSIRGGDAVETVECIHFTTLCFTMVLSWFGVAACAIFGILCMTL